MTCGDESVGLWPQPACGVEEDDVGERQRQRHHRESVIEKQDDQPQELKK